MMFLGAKFCSHCGAKADRTELSPKTVQRCPRCDVNTRPVVIGKTDLRECPRCEGLWVEASALQKICADREQQTAVLGAAMTIQPATSAALEQIRYLPCPVCRKLMNRVQFAKCSQVVVDVCKAHGTWCDKDELRRIVEFVRAGGFEKARATEISEWKREQRKLEDARSAAAHENRMAYGTSSYDSREFVLADVAVSLVDMFIN